MNKQFSLVPKEKLIPLNDALHFLHVEELKALCIKLCFLDTGKKKTLITRIVHFIKTGEVLKEPKVPAISCAKRGGTYPLHPDTLILKGAYKNDLQTRLFFKSLIGDYFHFTAFGIDWVHERWLEGNPPTYQQFADMWKVEYQRRKEEGSQPKEEWAYINFIQNFVTQHPNASRQDGLDAWEKELNKNRAIVHEILQDIISK